MLAEVCPEMFLKKLIGRKDIEDGLKRLDRLTREESRMAAAENLKFTHAVDGRVTAVVDTVADINNRVTGVDDRVAGVDERVVGVDERVAGVVDQVAAVDDRVQLTANNVDEIKRMSSLTSSVLPVTSADYETLLILQGTNCKRTFTNGSHHRTPRRTTTSRVVLITRCPQPGFSMAPSLKSGSQQDRFFGSTENVCLIHFLTLLHLILSCIVAGSGKSIIWFVGF